MTAAELWFRMFSLGALALVAPSSSARAQAVHARNAVESPGRPGATAEFIADGSSQVKYFVRLPSSYAPDKPSPLLFMFSPGGNEQTLLSLLETSCERRGWILVVPSRLRNGFVPDARLIEHELLADVRKKIPHDRRREYVGGFSGGATRAYRLTRSEWNEFAGVLALGGWLGTSDQRIIYPARMAVAMVNGDRDAGAHNYQAADLARLKSSGVRAHAFRFDGGHQIAPTEVLNEAFDWLENDWVKMQGSSAAMVRGETEAAEYLREAKAAMSRGNDRAAIELGLRILLEFAWTNAVPEARDLIAAMMSRRSKRQPKLDGPLKVGNVNIASAYLGQNFRHLPSAQRIAFNELALLLAPADLPAACHLAVALAESRDARLRDPARATALARVAITKLPQICDTWHCAAAVAAALGDTRNAIAYGEKAVEVALPQEKEEFELALESYRKPAVR